MQKKPPYLILVYFRIVRDRHFDFSYIYVCLYVCIVQGSLEDSNWLNEYKYRIC